MSGFQRRVSALVLLAAGAFVAHPAAAQPLTLAQGDGAVRALLEIEEAEQAAWLYSYRELNERYVWRGRAMPQLEAAIDVALEPREASETALDQLPPGFDVAGVRAAVESNAREWETLVAQTTHNAETASLSELLEGMRETPFSATLELVADAVAEGTLGVSSNVIAALRRALATRWIRQRLLGVQAEINAANSNLAAIEFDLRDLRRERDPAARAAVRTTMAQAAVLRRDLARFRGARTAMLSALRAWRSGATVERSTSGLRRALEADELQALQQHLREATATPDA